MAMNAVIESVWWLRTFCSAGFWILNSVLETLRASIFVNSKMHRAGRLALCLSPFLLLRLFHLIGGGCSRRGGGE